MLSEDAIQLSNVSKSYQIYNDPSDRLAQFIYPRVQRLLGREPVKYFREFWALKNLSFSIRRGASVGIIGRNGSGKSTLLQIICGILKANSGTIEVNGRVAALLELGSGFNPEFSGRENIFLNAAILGLSTKEVRERFDDIVAFSEIGAFIDQPIKTYSSGMVVRLAFAVAISVQPQILIIDEALAVGDAAFQRKCLRKIEDMKAAGVTLLFVSHDTNTVKSICSSAIYLKQGAIALEGDAKEVCIAYERDLFGASNTPATQGRVASGGLAPQFDPELTKVQEKAYGDGRAEIVDIAVRNADGKDINLIAPGQDFSISYSVLFRAGVTNPAFGFMIATREGVAVAGSNTSQMTISKRSFVAGERIGIRFNLTNNLGPGLYFLTCGVHAGDTAGGIVYLHRRIDNSILKSLPSDQHPIGGVANLYPTISLDLAPSEVSDG